ncbi:MAG: hypothetical protein Q9203_003541 [Teloschistes exilis]
MDAEEFRRAAHSAVDEIINYFSTMETRRVLSNVEPGYLRPLLPSAPPEEGENWDDIQKDIESKIMPGLTHWQSPNFMAFFPANATYSSILGEMYSAAFTAPAFNWLCSPACTELETIVLDYMCNLLHLPESFLSTSATGGGGVIQGSASEAIVTVMIAARERYVRQLSKLSNGDRNHAAVGKEEEEEAEWRLRSRLIALGSEMSHSSTQKATMIAGVKYKSINVSAADDFALTGRGLKEALENLKSEGLEPFYLTVTLGTTSTCAVDRFKEIAEVKKEFPNLWIHVDAAYAGAALILEEYRGLTQGFEFFDSFDFNMHKWLLTNFDASTSGLVTDYRDWQIPLGRRFRALKIWFVLRSYGVRGLKQHVKRHIDLGEQFARWVRDDGNFEIIATPMFALTVLRVKLPQERQEGSASFTRNRYDGSTETKINEGVAENGVPDMMNGNIHDITNGYAKMLARANAATIEVYEKVNAGGEIFLTSTMIKDVCAIRVVSANEQTDEKHLRKAFDILAMPTPTLHVSNAQVSATGNRQADDDVCPDYEICGTRGHRYWQTLQQTIALAQPVDRTDGPEKFERFYGIEFASFEDPIEQLRQDLIDHGINYDFLDGFAIFSKDPDTGTETEETAYQNMFQTDKGVIIAVQNFRHADEQKQLSWSELMAQAWPVAREWADDWEGENGRPLGGLISNIQTVIQARVLNDQTQRVVKTIWAAEEREYNVLDPTWYKFTLAEKPNWFYALLGTDNIRGTVWLLNDDAAEIGKKGARAASTTARKPSYASSAADETNQNPDHARWQTILNPLDTFPRRHIGPSKHDAQRMLEKLSPPAKSLDEFVNDVLPKGIASNHDLQVKGTPNGQDGFSESQLIKRLREIASGNQVMRNYIGCGYAGTRVPEVIKRNVLENPGWYTSYTPYQPEISQGRLESLLNFQTMVSDLTALSIANASVLDEPTAAAEAMTLSLNALPAARQKRSGKAFLVSHLCHPQTAAVLQSRADGFGIKIVVADILAEGAKAVKDVGDDLIGVLVQYPDTEGGVEDFQNLADIVHDMKATFCVGTDLLALTLLKPPGEFGADIAFGNAQRFGVPLGYGGPHAAFFACNDKYKRKIPGRLVGVSKDRLGNKAMRLALQTREQHIRREKATSNICTAQALLANMSAFYAIYHGPKGLQAIAQRARTGARFIEECLIGLGYSTSTRGKGSHGRVLFDTVTVNVENGAAPKIAAYAVDHYKMNLRLLDDSRIAITLDETVDKLDLEEILKVFVHHSGKGLKIDIPELPAEVPSPLMRTSSFLTHPVFNTHHSETELLRYIHHLQSKDLSLTHSMIPLGSCTMKLNATTEMIPVSWPEFSSMHPFAPADQAKGYKELIEELEEDLAEITGFHAVSLQPNSGAQGEFTGLRMIRKYHERYSDSANGKKRDICLIPVSAHGTNPASAAMAGMRVVTLKCEPSTGNLDMNDLREKCEKYKDELGAIMVTYPSTFGVFEPHVREVCRLVHEHKGLVYMDGANMNAQIGLCSPGDIGADVCHLNLHKTFCIPHGGGGPGVGPVGVTEALAQFLPGHNLIQTGGTNGIAPVSAAPWGSASILPISWAYIKMMGGRGLTHATKITLLNANYILSRLKPHYPILYTNEAGRCAHEFILDVRKFKDSAGIEAIDIAKRLQDYGFHAPTMSWPVANTLMIEPTESEDLAELDRFCDSLIEIRKEIKAIEDGEQPREGNVLKMAPHPLTDLLVDEEWERSYSRGQAAYPLPGLREKKFWPSVARLDDAYGDMNLFCSCGPVESIDGMTGVAAPAPT